MDIVWIPRCCAPARFQFSPGIQKKQDRYRVACILLWNSWTIQLWKSWEIYARCHRRFPYNGPMIYNTNWFIKPHILAMCFQWWIIGRHLYIPLGHIGQAMARYRNMNLIPRDCSLCTQIRHMYSTSGDFPLSYAYPLHDIEFTSRSGDQKCTNSEIK